MLHTPSAAAAERRRPLSLSRRVPLLLIASVLAACAPDRPTAPPIPPGAPTRPAVKYKEFSPSDIEAMLGRARLDTRGWRVLATVAPHAVTTAGHSGVAYTVATDTLIGYIGLSIMGTTAEASALAKATAHNSFPSVWLQGNGTTQIGIEIPLAYELYCEGDMQGHPWWCGDGAARTVNCNDNYGSNIEGRIESYVLYTSGAFGDGQSADPRTADPAAGAAAASVSPVRPAAVLAITARPTSSKCPRMVARPGA